jgi:acyl-CoA reductase-like NAD-dependent aldehyde dehydrogenase
VEDSSPESLAAAIGRCREAQASWASLSFGQRAAMLRRWRDLLLEAKAEFASILHEQAGEPESEALGYELFFVCDAIGYWGRAAGRILADRQPILHLFKHKRALSTHKPRGVVAIVASDRLPLLLTIGEAIPALMAGNGVILSCHRPRPTARPCSGAPLPTRLVFLRDYSRP